MVGEVMASILPPASRGHRHSRQMIRGREPTSIGLGWALGPTAPTESKP